MTILDAVEDPQLFAPWFARGDWSAWTAFLAALFALPMTPAQLTTYRACTGRKSPSAEPFTEAALVVGRRGGKSFILGVLAVFAACFRDFRPFLQPGERATVVVVAADRRQARTILRYVVALLEGVPMLRALIERQTADAIDLKRQVSIEVMTASFRTIRGYTVPVALTDEIAFFPTDDSANPDAEVLAALRPAMATIPGAMLLMASSPYARRGELWRTYKANYGRDDAPVLVWKAATRTMNPSVPQRVIDDATERDPASAAAEFGAEFRSDVEMLLSREAVEGCVDVGVLERPPVKGVTYWGFVDPSGGSSDSMTLAICHREDETAVIDAVREIRPPFSPESAVREFAALLKTYSLRSVTGDRYGGEWPRERFRSCGVEYRLAPATKSELYGELVAVVNSGRVSLLDQPRLQAQLIGLERRTSRGGRESIDHAPGAHDDLANAVAGCVQLAMRPRREEKLRIGAPIFVSGSPDWGGPYEQYH